MKKMRGLDLFTGYGGITLALKGYAKPIAYVEIEEYAQKIISYRMAEGRLPRAPILADVKNVQGQINDCDIIYGGFPCQDISTAGNGKGLAGERSGLFYEVVRLTKEIRPSFVFLENVPAIRTRGLEQVVKEFTQMGYDCRWTMLSAKSIGAPHKRERWFILAHSKGERLEINRLSVGYEKRLSLDIQPLAARSSPHPDHQSEITRQSGFWPKDFKNEWTLEGNNWDDHASTFLRMGHGDTFRMDRVKACGNGVVPKQVRAAFEKLMGIS